MKNTVQKRFTQTVTVAVALMLVFSVFGLIGTVAAQDVSVDQSESEVTAAPGETVELTTTLSTSDLNAHMLQVFLPGEWEGTITDADGGAPKPIEGSGNPLDVVWVSSGTQTYEVAYEVHVPEDAAEGDYTVDVEGSGIDPGDPEDPSDDTRIVESTQTTITVEEPDQNEAPSASFTYSPDSPQAGQQVSFDASGSSDDSAIANYEWDVDGETLGDDGAQATHTFDAAGDYDVTLTVTDDDGATDSATQTVSVSEGSDDSDEDDSDDGDDGDDSDEDDSDDSNGDDSDDSDEDNSDDSDDGDDGDDADDGDSNEDDSNEQSGEDCSPEEKESLDSDGDGLTDAEEKELGTDPYDADTDGDCVSDGDEVEAGTDPLCSTCC